MVRNATVCAVPNLRNAKALALFGGQGFPQNDSGDELVKLPCAPDPFAVGTDAYNKRKSPAIFAELLSVRWRILAARWWSGRGRCRGWFDLIGRENNWPHASEESGINKLIRPASSTFGDRTLKPDERPGFDARLGSDRKRADPRSLSRQGSRHRSPARANAVDQGPPWQRFRLVVLAGDAIDADVAEKYRARARARDQEMHEAIAWKEIDQALGRHEVARFSLGVRELARRRRRQDPNNRRID